MSGHICDGRPGTTDWLLDGALAVAEPAASAARFAGHCALDWFGVALAGAQEPAVSVIAQVLAGGAESVGLIARDCRAGPIDAALINAAAGHALDYDDTIAALPGHLTGIVLPALLAVGARVRPNGEQLLGALVAGVEVGARLGLAVGPDHYSAGFHSTSTLGPFGAAIGCGILLGFDRDQLRHALALTVSESAGLKIQFGTAAKPFQAGRAAADGVRAALLVEAGLRAAPDAIDGEGGFLDIFGRGAGAVSGSPPAEAGAAIEQTLFKRHVTCQLTQATIEAARELRERGVSPDRIDRISLTVAPGLSSVCAIPEPADATEAKFSLALATAMGLAGIDTTNPATFTDALPHDPDLVALRDRVVIDFGAADHPLTWAALRVISSDGTTSEAEHDTGIPAADLDGQEDYVADKARTLATPIIGANAAALLVGACLRLPSACDPVAELDRLVMHRGTGR